MRCESCNQWKPEWIASLYGELEAAEEAELRAHLEVCTACRDELASLSASRAVLREAAPAVPSAPPVVVLEPRGQRWSTVWSFAAGLACAASLFGLGFLTASTRMARPTEATGAIVANTDEALPELRTQLASLQRRLSELEQAPAEPAMTAVEFRQELERLEDRYNRDRAGDLEYLMRSMTATDLRTADWMNRTEQALTYIAARQDPRLSER